LIDREISRSQQNRRRRLLNDFDLPGRENDKPQKRKGL
jgi:hypothetical protein